MNFIMRWLLISCFTMISGQAWAKELGRFMAEDGSIFLKVSTPDSSASTQGVVINQMTSFTVRTYRDVKGKGEELVTDVSDLTFDAQMPEHQHGMVVKPKVTAIGPGEFRVDGIKLHMAGNWELIFTVKRGRDTVKFKGAYYL